MPTPKELGYSMPAEWEKHSAVWLSWPYDRDSFPKLERAEQTFSKFVSEVSESELVNLLVRDNKMQTRANAALNEAQVDLSNIVFHHTDYADIWFRDYGPIFVTNTGEKKLALTKWIFNAWGEKYKELLKDNEVPFFMNKTLSLPLFEPGIVLEGGSIDVNGKGDLLTTEQCLLNKNRNPKLSKDEIEKYLSDYLGANNVIWLKEGIEGDDTDGHIDDIARFVDEETILCIVPDDKDDKDYPSLKENFEILKNAKNSQGKSFKVVTLPTPGSILSHDGDRLPASYANFYIANSKVLVPIFGTTNDEKALEIIADSFSGRKVVGINAYEIVHGFGTFHCMSQQHPEL